MSDVFLESCPPARPHTGISGMIAALAPRIEFRRKPRNNRLRRLPRRNRRGLIGVLLSIIVIVVIIGAIFGAYNQVTGSADAARASVFVRQLAPQITAQYRGNYADIHAEAVISSGFVPDDWVSGKKIKSPDGTGVTVAAVADDGTANAAFTITFTGGVPTPTCKAVLGALKSDRTLKTPANIRTGGQINTACARSDSKDFVLKFK